MATSHTLPVDLLRQALEYRDGKLFWKVRPDSHFPRPAIAKMWNKRWAGKEAGTFRQTSWRYPEHIIRFDDYGYRRADLVWAIIKGEWPTITVDHENRDSLDDRIENLRLATKSQNLGNARRRKDNTSGYKGVSFHKQTGKFKACIQHENDFMYLGLFSTAEEAHEAYCEAAKRLFKEFAHDGT